MAENSFPLSGSVYKINLNGYVSEKKQGVEERIVIYENEKLYNL